MPDFRQIGLQGVMEVADFVAGANKYQNTLNDMEKSTDVTATKLGGLEKVIKIGGLAAVVAAAAIGTVLLAAVVKLGRAAWESGMMFDTAFDTIMVRTGATGAEFNTLKGDLKDVFTSVPTDVNSAAEAISTLNGKLGITGPTLQGVSESLLEATRMTGGNIQTNSENLAELAQKWGIENTNLTATLDQVWVAAQKTGSNFSTLLGNLNQYGPVLHTMGLNVNQATAMLAAFDKAGVNIGTTMMGMRTAATTFAKDGVAIGKGFSDAILSIKNAKTETDALAIATKTFGSRAAVELTTAIRNGAIAFDQLLPAMLNSRGAIDKTSQATMDASEKFLLMKNQMSTALEPIGSAMMDLASKAGTLLLPAITKIANTFTTTLAPALMKALPGITDFISKGLVILADWLSVKIPAAIAGFEQFWNNTLMPIFIVGGVVIVAAFTNWAIAAGAAAIATIAALSPIILIVGAIAGAIALLVLAWNNDWLGIRTAITTAWALIGPIFDTLRMIVGTILVFALQTLITWWNNLWLGLQTIGNFISSVFIWYWNSLAAGIQLVVDAVVSVYNWFSDLWDQMNQNWAALVDIFMPGSEPPLAQGLYMIGDAAYSTAGAFGVMADAATSSATMTGTAMQNAAYISSLSAASVNTSSTNMINAANAATAAIDNMAAAAAGQPHQVNMPVGVLSPGTFVDANGNPISQGYMSPLDILSWQEQVPGFGSYDVPIPPDFVPLPINPTDPAMRQMLQNMTEILNQQRRDEQAARGGAGRTAMDVEHVADAVGDLVDNTAAWNRETEVSKEQWSWLQDIMGGKLGEELARQADEQEITLKRMNLVEKQMQMFKPSYQDIVSPEHLRAYNDLKDEYDDLKKQYDAYAEAHALATRKILFDIIAQQAAVDGMSQGEVDTLTALAVQWGMVDYATAEAMAQASDAMAYLSETGDITGALAMILAMGDAWLQVGSDIAYANSQLDPYIPHSPPPLAKGLTAITRALDDASRSYQGLYSVANGTMNAGFTNSMNAPGVSPRYGAAPIYNEVNRSVSVNMGGVNINNGMGIAQLEAMILRTVKNKGFK